MVTFAELIEKVEEAEEKYAKYFNIPEGKERFYLYLEKYKFHSYQPFASSSFIDKLKNVDNDFIALIDHRLLDESKGDRENFAKFDHRREWKDFGEARQLLYEKIDKLIDIFCDELDEGTKKVEQEIANFDINKQFTNTHQFKNYVGGFSNRVLWGENPFSSSHDETLVIINDINYKRIRDKIYEVIEKLDEKAWMMVGFSQQETKNLQQNFLSYHASETDSKKGYRYWASYYFPQGSIVNKTYRDFDPLNFTFKEIDELVEKKYNRRDLDEQRKYRGQNPFEKSKDEWDKVLGQDNNRIELDLNQRSDFGKNGLENNSPSSIESPPPTQRNEDSSQKLDEEKEWPYKKITISLFSVACIVAILWFGFFKKRALISNNENKFNKK